MVLVVPSYACAALDALLALGKVVVICWKRPLEVVLQIPSGLAALRQ
jgi:hypothetical protein